MGVSAAALNASASQTESTAEQKATFGLNSNLLFLVPTITGIALGILCIPNFGLGIAVGATDFLFSFASLLVMNATKITGSDEKEGKSTYRKSLEDNLLYTSVFGPIAEEGIFRGIVQPLLTRAIQIIVPAAAAVAFGPLSIATTISIVVSGILFGAVHYTNKHQHAGTQAILCSVGGIVYGALAAQFGIGASIAAHITNNTIVSIFMALENRSDHSIAFSTPE